MKKRVGIDYDYLFHALPGRFLVMAVDEPHYTIVEVNDALCDIVGISRDDMINQPLRQVFPESDNTESQEGTASVVASIRRCIASAKPDSVGVVRYDLVRADGSSERRLWNTVHYPIIKQGVVRGVILWTEDVTEKFDDPEYMKVKREYLEHLVQVNESKDEFISVASHQLRTPATGVKQYLGMLRDNMFGGLNDKQRDLLERANESNERQLGIVTDLLKVAQVDAGKLMLHTEPIDINQLVLSVIQDASASFNAREQVLVFQAANSPAITMVDKTVVRMVIENIIDNASKYTQPGKQINVTVQEDHASVVVTVIDQGVGIAKDKRSVLFEKFSRIHNPLSTQVGGTGLGLYWAKKSVELHGGSIVYEPVRRGGSCFTIRLPKV